MKKYYLATPRYPYNGDLKIFTQIAYDRAKALYENALLQAEKRARRARRIIRITMTLKGREMEVRIKGSLKRDLTIFTEEVRQLQAEAWIDAWVDSVRPAAFRLLHPPAEITDEDSDTPSDPNLN